MTDFLLSFIAGGKLPALFGGLAAVLAIIFGVFRAGRKSARNKQLRREIDARDDQLEMHREDDEIRRRTRGMTDDEARQEAGQWSAR